LNRTAIRIRGRIHLPVSALPQDAFPSGRRPNQQPAPARGPLASLHNNERLRRGQHDGLPGIAFLGGPDHDRGMGGVVVSAEVIPFVPRLNRRRKPVHFPPASLHPTPRPDDLTMDHVDTAPCEYLSSLDPPVNDLKNG
jgi:hypothetical protein